MKYDIEVYEDGRGRSPLRDYLKELKGKNDNDSRLRLTKIQTYVNLLEENGTFLPKTICKHFSSKKYSWLWELHPGGDRVLFFAWSDGRFVLLHAFEKKGQKAPESELKQAERECKDWKERNGK